MDPLALSSIKLDNYSAFLSLLLISISTYSLFQSINGLLI